MRYVFIDESGNLGRSGRFFTMAAIVCGCAKAATRLKRIMKQACLEYAPGDQPLPEIHATHLGFERKQKLISKMITRADHQVFILAADKRHLSFQLAAQNRNIGYNYLAGILVKGIVRKFDEDICLTFDERSTKVTSRDSLLDYLRMKASFEWGYRRRLEFCQADSRQVYCLQAADLVANVSYRAYQYQHTHLLDLLRPRIEQVVEFPYAKFNR